MDARQERGLVLSKNKGIRQIVADQWLVPSQSGAGGYVVDLTKGACTCPDHETRRVRCKHVFAAEIVARETVVQATTNADGSKTITETTREVRVRKTYPQNWPAYNAAQMEEKERVQDLLRALCDGIQQPAYKGKGRPPLPLADVVYGATLKVYTTVSGRRATTDIREAAKRGHLDDAVHYNSLFNALAKPELTPLLRTLVEESAAPLKVIETSFGVDSTGFSTSTYRRWFDEKYGTERSEATWVKLHAMVGVKTNVVVSVEVTGEEVGDAPMLKPLVETTAKRFTIAEVSGDKAYLSRANLDAIEAVGAVPYVPFKINSKGDGPAAWRRLWHLFHVEHDQFVARYHQRSNVESTFSAMKRKFGGSVRSKLPESQKNEALLKCLAFNLSVLVHEMRELGIEPKFPKRIEVPS